MYLDDFDGVIAGAFAMQMVTPHNVFAYASNARSDGSSILDRDAINLLASAVLESCDMDDGVSDGVLGNPQACSFEPAALRCNGAASRSCLSNEQVEAAKNVYAGASRNDGTSYYPMGYARGTERDWISGFPGVDGQPPRRAGSAQFTIERKIGPDATLVDSSFPLPPNTILAGRTLYPYPAASVFNGDGNPTDPIAWHAK